MSDYPSDVDFQHAKGRARERSLGLDEVCSSVKSRFKDHSSLHNVHILPQRDVDYRAYVFFDSDRNLSLAEDLGLRKQIQSFIRHELELLRCGAQTAIEFEFDSDENVKRSYEGDYFLRLR